MTDWLIERDPNILGGCPLFAGTRVPVRILMEHLEAGDRSTTFGWTTQRYRGARPWRFWDWPKRCWCPAAMKLLLDNSLLKRLAASLKLRTVQETDWEGRANGLLLSLAAREDFDAFVTVDCGIKHQSKPDALPIPIVLMPTVCNRLKE